MTANQAPIADRTTEATFKNIRKRIQATFKNKKHAGSNNTTNDQLKALKILQKNEAVIAKPSDMCKGLVLLNREDHVSKAQNMTAS